MARIRAGDPSCQLHPLEVCLTAAVVGGEDSLVAELRGLLDTTGSLHDAVASLLSRVEISPWMP